MNKYDEMSDFEINKAVAYILYADIDGMDYTEYLIIKHSKEEGANAIYYCGGQQLDYCNLAGDAWPIIVKYEISLLISCDEWIAEFDFQTHDDEYNDCIDDWCVEGIDKNPLRAAMICFLKMKDAEDDR